MIVDQLFFHEYVQLFLECIYIFYFLCFYIILVWK